jgi:hypothetical protein
MLTQKVRNPLKCSTPSDRHRFAMGRVALAAAACVILAYACGAPETHSSMSSSSAPSASATSGVPTPPPGTAPVLDAREPVPTAIAGRGDPGVSGSSPPAVPPASSQGDGGSAGAATAGAPAPAQAPAPDPGSPRLPPAMSVDAAGGFITTQDLASGPRGASGLFHPTELGEGGLLHPIVLWGCGGTTQPATYAMHMNRLASHGFVAIAEVSEIGNNGEILLEALDWLLSENERPDSVLYQHLDTTKIAAGGHSIGSANTFFIAADPRLTTTVHIAGGSLDDVNDPFAPTTGMGGKKLVHPAAFICSESDTFGNVEKTEQDYANTSVPVFFTVMRGTEHNGAATEGLAATVAWLRWQLGGDIDRSRMFLDPMGEFRTGRYVSQIKNW